MYVVINREKMALVSKHSELKQSLKNEYFEPKYLICEMTPRGLHEVSDLELKLLYRSLGFVNGTSLTSRDSVMKSVIRLLSARVDGDAPVESADTSDDNEDAPVTPSAPRTNSTRPTIWAEADKAWEAAGKPTDIATILAMRKALMTELEFAHGIKKTTSSTALGDWQKARLK